MRIFNEFDLSQFLEAEQLRFLNEIREMDRDELLKMNETQLVEYISDKYHLDPFVFDFDNVTASDYEEMIPASEHPGDRFFLTEEGGGGHTVVISSLTISLSAEI